MHRTPRSSTPKSFREAFTLIELLVVIAIIAVLAALTVPTVSGAIARSKSAKCLSNLRQIGVALIGYTTENGRFPCDTNTAASTSWADYLGPYFPMTKGSTGNVQDKVYRCPAETNQPPSGFTKSVKHYTGTYAMFLPGPTGGISQANGGRPIAAVENPSQTLILVDGKLQNNSGYNCGNAATYTSYSADCGQASPANTKDVRFRHSGDGMNALYVDGHVGTISWTNRTNVTKAMWEGRNY